MFCIKARKNPVHRKKDETKWVEVEEDEEPQSEDGWTVGVIQTRAPSQPIRVKVEINGRPVTMEVDTGAAVSLMSEKNWKDVLSGTPLKKSSLILQTYTAEQMPVVGECQVAVQYGDQQKMLTLYVVKGHGPSLLGREWLRSIQLDWKSIGQVTVGRDCFLRGAWQTRDMWPCLPQLKHSTSFILQSAPSWFVLPHL